MIRALLRIDPLYKNDHYNDMLIENELNPSENKRIQECYCFILNCYVLCLKL